MTPGELAAVPVFADFPEHDLRLVAGIVRALDFAPGTVLIEQGEKPRAAYVLLAGEVEVLRRLPGGARTRLAVLPPGTMFGTVSLLDGGPRAASCAAVGPVRVAEFSADDFQRLASASTPLGVRFLQAVARQLIRDIRATNARVTELVSLGRIAPDDLASSLGGWV